MSGRDVRRLAAKASNITPAMKRDLVARVAIGADVVGVKDIFVTAEPFRIASQALSLLQLSAKVHILETPLQHTAKDTELAVESFLNAGVNTIVSLGGDGTNRALIRCAVAQKADDLNLIPISAGTNNAFPSLAEPTIAGMVAGLSARGQLGSFRRRCKILHLQLHDGSTDLGLVDAAALADDSTGNLLPFDTRKLRRLLLTQADPAAVGMASIGGLVNFVSAEEDAGLLVEINNKGKGLAVTAPISPGLFEEVIVTSTRKVLFNETINMTDNIIGRGVLALDGDRDHKLDANQPAYVTIRRDGPWVIDTISAIRYAAEAGLLKKN